MRNHLSVMLVATLLAGCAVPAGLNLPAAVPQAPQAPLQLVPAERLPVVATGTGTANKPGKVLNPTSVTRVEPEKVLTPKAVAVPAVKPAEKTYAMADFDPGKVLLSLPSGIADMEDDPTDDIDEAEGFSTKWLWGWGGLSGRDRGLRTFAKEEGRVIEWLQYPSGWTAMRAMLTDTELPGAVALALSPVYNRTATSSKFLPDGLKRRTKRHLKFFRRQDIVKLRSKHLMYYQVQRFGQTAVAGYIARAEAGTDKYIAYYDGAGHFLWAYGSNYPYYGYSPTPYTTANSSDAEASDGAAGP